MLDEFLSKQFSIIDIKDKLFNKFCSLLEIIRQSIRHNNQRSSPILEVNNLSAI